MEKNRTTSLHILAKLHLLCRYCINLKVCLHVSAKENLLRERGLFWDSINWYHRGWAEHYKNPVSEIQQNRPFRALGQEKTVALPLTTAKAVSFRYLLLRLYQMWSPEAIQFEKGFCVWLQNISTISELCHFMKDRNT